MTSEIQITIYCHVHCSIRQSRLFPKYKSKLIYSHFGRQFGSLLQS